MSIDFFDENCQSITDKLEFGICDDQPQKPAYLDFNNKSKWIATVENANNILITFTAIDDCINIPMVDDKMPKRCDGMLTYESNLIFVELKERNYKNQVWIEEGKEQLKNTIDLFLNNNIKNYRSKKAYIANSKKPKFPYSHKETMQKFRNETGFMLTIEAKIKISKS